MFAVEVLILGVEEVLNRTALRALFVLFIYINKVLICYKNT